LLNAVFGDIHGNLDALETCVAHMKEVGVEYYVCLGDVIGYGAQPNECLTMVRELTDHIIAGNHEYAVCGKMGLEFFNAYAKEAIEWTRDQLSEDELEFIRRMPLVEQVNGYTIAHSTLHAPEAFGYIETLYSAHMSLSFLEDKVCFVGHSHVPITFVLDQEQRTLTYTVDEEITLGASHKALVNVGSVGQPRDENPKASYATYDTESGEVKIHRLEYDVESAAQKIRDAGLPEVLSSRLVMGR
jgi:diadenosine tetraphosphatase ApaH/serine/threonine PP2A family protein phosphatase